MPTFTFEIPTPPGNLAFAVTSGTSLLFVGANGCGKTRLAVQIETILGLAAHRISAHRALSLNTAVAKISEVEALNGLRTGYKSREATVSHRQGNRWGSRSSVMLLNDYDTLVQSLFADQTNKALETHQKVRAGNTGPADPTKFEILAGIWETLLPHRKLKITGDDIQVVAEGSPTSYKAEEMSDGERAIFYLIGQTLCAQKESVIIFDEPELHIHRAIMARLWDHLESARPDCAFIFISHDLEFVASRVGQKYVIQKYDAAGKWELEKIPENTGFSEELTTQILGSRKPILFVEGTGASLDLAIYRSCYPTWTVIPRGSCENVIHSVATMRHNASLTRITCSGIVDADDYAPDDIAYLNDLGIKVLPVSEIENLLLLPPIAKAIGKHEGHDESTLTTKLQSINSSVVALIQQGDNLEKCLARYTRRRIDRILKKIDLSSATTVNDIAAKYVAETGALNVQTIAGERRTKINNSIRDGNIPALMALYDNKGLPTIVATHMKATRLNDFQDWLVRIMGSHAGQEITSAFISILPPMTAQ